MKFPFSVSLRSLISNPWRIIDTIGEQDNRTSYQRNDTLKFILVPSWLDLSFSIRCFICFINLWMNFDQWSVISLGSRLWLYSSYFHNGYNLNRKYIILFSKSDVIVLFFLVPIFFLIINTRDRIIYVNSSILSIIYINFLASRRNNYSNEEWFFFGLLFTLLFIRSNIFSNNSVSIVNHVRNINFRMYCLQKKFYLEM